MLIIEDPGELQGLFSAFGREKEAKKEKIKKGTRNRVGLKTKPEADPEHATIPCSK